MILNYVLAEEKLKHAQTLNMEYNDNVTLH